jgi:hypothetical protein
VNQIFSLRFGNNKARKIFQNANIGLAKIEARYARCYDAWKCAHPQGTLADFDKESAAVSFTADDGVVTSAVPATLAEHMKLNSGFVTRARACSHWSLAAVGMVGGLLFGGAFFAFVYLALPILLSTIPTLGVVATFLAASSLHVPICAAGTFFFGLIISVAIHRSMYPYAGKVNALPGEENSGQTAQEN